VERIWKVQRAPSLCQPAAPEIGLTRFTGEIRQTASIHALARHVLRSRAVGTERFVAGALAGGPKAEGIVRQGTVGNARRPCALAVVELSDPAYQAGCSGDLVWSTG